MGFEPNDHCCNCERCLVQDLVKDKTYQHKQFNSYLLKMTQSKSLAISLWKMMIDSWFSPWTWWIFTYENVGSFPIKMVIFPMKMVDLSMVLDLRLSLPSFRIIPGHPIIPPSRDAATMSSVHVEVFHPRRCSWGQPSGSKNTKPVGGKKGLEATWDLGSWVIVGLLYIYIYIIDIYIYIYRYWIMLIYVSLSNK